MAMCSSLRPLLMAAFWCETLAAILSLPPMSAQVLEALAWQRGSSLYPLLVAACAPVGAGSPPSAAGASPSSPHGSPDENQAPPVPPSSLISESLPPHREQPCGGLHTCLLHV